VQSFCFSVTEEIHMSGLRRSGLLGCSLQGLSRNDLCSQLNFFQEGIPNSFSRLEERAAGKKESVMSFVRSYRSIFFVWVCLCCLLALPAKAGLVQDQAQTASAEPKLTEAEMKQFLLTAKVIKSKQTSTGVTQPYRLTLSDGKLAHDGGFQSIDEFESQAKMSDGKTEINFRDSYHSNIAAYEIAKLVGLGAMIPVTVERKWEGKKGSLTWWLDSRMDEAELIAKKVQPPDVDAYNRQFDTMMVFSELICDVDRNRTNMLIGPNWELYMIDFSRAFRLHNVVANEKNLIRCSRQLLEKLRQLDAAEVARVTKGHLDKSQIKALMARRDKIVALFEQLIKQKGESAIIF
jgi:hypothetical protein